MQKPLLSICIPTFNRAELLSYSLTQILKVILNFQVEIEIIVSDNNSTDNTKEIVADLKNNHPNLIYFKNTENIGFNYNILKIIDHYANGEFCWIIGDDDFIYNHSISKLLKILKGFDKIDFVYTNYDLKDIDEIRRIFDNKGELNRNYNINSPNGYFCKFDEIIAKEYRSSNMLLTFISTTIFRTSMLRNTDKTLINKESWFDFKSLFPHSYLYSVLMQGRNSYFFETPLIFAAVHEKSWDDKLPLLYLKYIPELFEFYKVNKYSNKTLERTYEKIIISAIPFLIQNNVNITIYNSLKYSFIKKYFTRYDFYRTLYYIAIRKLKSVIK